MNKSILITENKIIKEDAIEQVSSSLSFEKGLSFIGDILKGVLNVTESTINDIATGIKLLGTTVMFPDEFEKALKKGQQKRSELDREWKSIKSSLDIDKPIKDFLNVSVPGLGIANDYLDKKMNKSYFDNNSFLKTLVSPAMSFYDINKAIFKSVFNKDSISNEGKKNSANFEEYYKWFTSLNEEDQNKINKWSYENQDDFQKMITMINDGKVNEVIKIFKTEILNENKSFIIKNSSILKEADQIPKDFFEEELRKGYIKSLVASSLADTIDDEKQASKDTEELLKAYKEILDQNEESVEEVISKETETN